MSDRYTVVLRIRSLAIPNCFSTSSRLSSATSLCVATPPPTSLPSLMATCPLTYAIPPHTWWSKPIGSSSRCGGLTHRKVSDAPELRCRTWTSALCSQRPTSTAGVRRTRSLGGEWDRNREEKG
eukprot:scaffold388_cov244-Pinguiococcus_pyrenoidosus.AAC.26